MIIRQNKSFYTFWLFLLFLAVIDVNNASTSNFDSKTHTTKIKNYERRMGPFKLNNKEYLIIVKLKKYKGASEGFNETVESFSIVDNEGKIHYEKSFNIVFNELGFAEAVSIHGYALESCNIKFFRYDSGRLIEDVLKKCVSKGLILYYGIVPGAPSAGVSCQVFTLKKECLSPLFAPLTVYGTIYDLPHGSKPNARKLFDGNTMKFGVWTGWFEVIGHLKVLDGLKVAPLHHNLTFGYDAFEVRVERSSSREETFVRLFEYPAKSCIPRHVIIKKDTKVEFLLAYTKLSIKSYDNECEISIDTSPWLKVRINGKEGFARDEEDLLALGIHPAG